MESLNTLMDFHVHKPPLQNPTWVVGASKHLTTGATGSPYRSLSQQQHPVLGGGAGKTPLALTI